MLLNEVKDYIQKYHVEEPVPDHKLVNAAARGMVSELARGERPDRHSAFFDEDEWKMFREHISGHYGGIGAVVQFVKHFDTGKEPVFTASAVSGQGVLESFFGLLYLTWTRLDEEHQLANKLGIRPDQFLTMAARKLGHQGDVGSLLAACVGGRLLRAGKGR
jgi:hypothetical protein